MNTNQIIKQAQEVVKSSRFGKDEGGSSFECSDYEGMYTDLVERVFQAITQAVEEAKAETIKKIKDAIHKSEFYGDFDGEDFIVHEFENYLDKLTK